MQNILDYNNYPTRKSPIKLPTMSPKKLPSVETTKKDFPMPTLPKIHGWPKWEYAIHIYNITSKNVYSILYNLGGGSYRIIALTLDPEQYQKTTGHDNEPPYPGKLTI